MPTQMPTRMLALMMLFFIVTAHCIRVDEAVLRACDAAAEYDACGLFARGANPVQNEPNVLTTTIFGDDDRIGTDIACFRIPSIVTTNRSELVVVVEARHESCADCSRVSLVSKRSLDDGETWGVMRTIVPPDDINGNPTMLYDDDNQAIVLYYARGVAENQPFSTTTTVTSCVLARSNWVVRSYDGGRSWSPSTLITPQLGSMAGALPGPGNAVVTRSGRYVVPLHFGTAERAWGYDGVLLSDDAGRTHRVSTLPTTFPRMDEATVARVVDPTDEEQPRETLVMIMRNAHNNATCNCKARSVSTDGGDTWSPFVYEPALLDPICQGSALGTSDGRLVFGGPDFAYARARPTLWWTDEVAAGDAANGSTTPWPWNRTRLADATVFFDYSSLVELQATPVVQAASTTSTLLGVAWGGCELPLPYRVWCLEGWVIRFSRAALPSSPRE